MTTKNEVPDHIQIKIREADEAPIKILDLCLKQLIVPAEVTLKEMSSRLGSMSHNLRSALNNMMWDFAELHLKKRIPAKEYDAVRWSHDFPIEPNKTSFYSSKSRILRHIKDIYPPVYEYLDHVQPYFPPTHLLWALKLMSNDSTHTIPVKVLQPNISDIVFMNGAHPQVIGNKVIIPFNPNAPLIRNTPCFIELMDMFVSAEGNWQIYMIDLDLDPKYSVTSFLNQAIPVVTRVIEGYYNVAKSAG